MPEAFTNLYFLFFGSGAVVAVVAIVAGAWTSIHRTRQESELKRDMLRRDMSVEDIERVLAATSDSEGRSNSPAVTGMDSSSLQEVVSQLAENHASPAVIEEVLTALRSVDVPTQALVSVAVQTFYASAEDGADGEQILAVVRPLCRPKAQTTERAAQVRDERVTNGI